MLLTTLSPSCLPCTHEPERSHSIAHQTIDIQLAGLSGQVDLSLLVYSDGNYEGHEGTVAMQHCGLEVKSCCHPDRRSCIQISRREWGGAETRSGQLCPDLEAAEETLKKLPIAQATNTHLLVSVQVQGSPLKAEPTSLPSMEPRKDCHRAPWLNGRT